MKILFVGALGNPFGAAWLELLQQLDGVLVAAFDTASRGGSAHIHRDHSGVAGNFVGPVVEQSGQAAKHVEAAFGGPPDVAVSYWGYRSIRPALETLSLWPNTRVVLIVDTLPDARSLPGEVREWTELRRQSKRLAGLIAPSHQMLEDLYRCRIARSARRVVLPSLMPKRSFARPVSALPDAYVLPSTDTPRVVFVGRPDHLWDTAGGMRKDALGTTLDSVAKAGAEVWIPSFTEAPAHTFQSYPKFTLADMLDGTFATYLSQFDGNVVCYNEYNRTIKRRVRNGLSTRAATALTTPVPWLISSHSAPLVRDLWPLPLGEVFTGELSTEHLNLLRVRGDEFRANWQDVKEQLHAEAWLPTLSNFLRSVV